MNAEYYAEIHSSVKSVDPQDWYSLIDSSTDLAMDQRLIHLLETTLSDQARFWTVAVRDRQHQLVACACLSLFQTDIVQSTPGFLQPAIQRLRVCWPNALKLKVLFCGLPLPSGHSHFRLRSSTDSRSVLKLLNKVMTNLARQEKAQLLVFKELDAAQNEELKNLQAFKFVCGELEPIYLLTRSFKDFEAYQTALRSTYRRQIQLNIKKFNTAGLAVEHFFEPEEICSRFSDSVHQLYLNVWARAKEKLECFPADFFRALPRALPNQVAFTLISDQQKPVAFAIGLVTEEVYHNLYVGLDYSYAESADLYFNLFYHELDAVFRAGKQKIFLGQTSRFFKSRLGAVPESRFFWVRPLNPFLHLIFKHFKKLIFPKIISVTENQVFREE